MIRYTNAFPPSTQKYKKDSKKKKKTHVYNSGIILPRMVYEPHTNVPSRSKPKTHIKGFAKKNQKNQTAAEIEFQKYLDGLNGGAVRGQFRQQHIFSPKWILDFFFSEIRLGIEIDGSIHNTPAQKLRDARKNKDAKKFEITLIRIRNSEVFGDKEILTKKLRFAWKVALDGKRGLVEFPTFSVTQKQQVTTAAKKRLVLIICKGCGHTKKKLMTVPKVNGSYRCSVCNSHGTASVID